MITRVYSLYKDNLAIRPITIEISSKRGIPTWNLVGLPGRAIRESKDRVIASLLSIGIDPRAYSWTFNFQPAHFPKDGTHFDLALAIGIIHQLKPKMISPQLLTAYLVGELSLEGEILAISHLYNFLHFLKDHPEAQLVVPLVQSRLLPEFIHHNLVGCHVLQQLIQTQSILPSTTQIDEGSKPMTPIFENQWENSEFIRSTNWSFVKNDPFYLLSLKITLLFRASMMITGEPGLGKSYFASIVQNLSPTLSFQEKLELLRFEEIAQNPSSLDDLRPPFYSPMPNVTEAGLLGGGVHFSPGIVSLASYGTVFVDEALEYKKHFLEILRQPLSEKRIEYYRNKTKVQLDVYTRFIFATNLCPCGNHTEACCICKSNEIQRYRNGISKALLERIDLHLHLTQPLEKTPKNNKELYLNLIHSLNKHSQYIVDNQAILKEIQQVASNRESQQRAKLRAYIHLLHYGDCSEDKLNTYVQYFRRFYLDF